MPASTPETPRMTEEQKKMREAVNFMRDQHNAPCYDASCSSVFCFLMRALAASEQEVERLKGAYAMAVDELHRLGTELAAAREDSARLDWLERSHAQVIPCQTDVDQWDGWNIWDDITHKDLGDGETLRAAIDTARSTDDERTHGETR